MVEDDTFGPFIERLPIDVICLCFYCVNVIILDLL